MLTGSAHDGGFGILRVSLIAFFLSLWFTTAGAENAFEDRGTGHRNPGG